jgi:hypothetical protein
VAERVCRPEHRFSGQTFTNLEQRAAFFTAAYSDSPGMVVNIVNAGAKHPVTARAPTAISSTAASLMNCICRQTWEFGSAAVSPASDFRWGALWYSGMGSSRTLIHRKICQDGGPVAFAIWNFWTRGAQLFRDRRRKPGILFFVPQIIKAIGVTDNMTVGWLTMTPYISGGVGLVTWGLVSDRMNERRWNLLAACAVSAIGLIIAGVTIGSWWAMVGLSIATFGFYGSKGPFWAMPPMFLTGTAAAASIAWINSLGNLGGFFGPWYVGVIKDWTGSYAGGLYGLAFLCVISAVVCALFLHIPNPTISRDRTAALAAD